jgi:hypothetical protein
MSRRRFIPKGKDTALQKIRQTRRRHVSGTVKASVENAVKYFSTMYVTADKTSALSFKNRGRKV